MGVDRNKLQLSDVEGIVMSSAINADNKSKFVLTGASSEILLVVFISLLPGLSFWLTIQFSSTIVPSWKGEAIQAQSNAHAGFPFQYFCCFCIQFSKHVLLYLKKILRANVQHTVKLQNINRVIILKNPKKFEKNSCIATVIFLQCVYSTQWRKEIEKYKH